LGLKVLRSDCVFSLESTGHADDDIVFEDFARLRLKGASQDDADV